jgi:pimeloyl-ACP methyl ester carboxylesterase
VHALASSGAVAIVPEVPEWRELQLAPEQALPTILATLKAVREHPQARPGPIGLAAFSFGTPQALEAATHPDVARELGCLVGFGGYCDLERTIRFQITGVHEWEGRTYRSETDPYGRWIVAANYLTQAEGFEQHGEVREALVDLAIEAGDRQAPIRGPFYLAFAERARSELPARSRPVFDLLVHPGRPDPEPEQAEKLVVALAGAARRASPLNEPASRLGAVEVPVHLLHGRADTLIPFTEALRLGEALGDVVERLTITGLFSHSKGEPIRPLRVVREGTAFFRALNAILRGP